MLYRALFESHVPTRMIHTRLLTVLLTASCALTAVAQDGSAETKPKQETTQKIRWPNDEARVICVVAGTKHTVGQMIDYVEKQHWPGLRKFLELPAGRLYFKSPLIAHWVRQYADIQALRLEAREREMEQDKIDELLSESLKIGFAMWSERYWAERAKQGITAEPTQQTINNLLTRFQNEFGLETELGGWLAALVPPVPVDNENVIRSYYTDNARFFGGRVTISHILLRHRDPRTGELLIGRDRREHLRKLNRVRAQLEEDGSNFEEVARLVSEDPQTASEGGMMRNIERFDPKLPAALCRAAWKLTDGEMFGPFESAFGTHFIKRLSYKHTSYALYTDIIKPKIAATMRKHLQEDLLFLSRDKFKIELKY